MASPPLFPQRRRRLHPHLVMCETCGSSGPRCGSFAHLSRSFWSPEFPPTSSFAVPLACAGGSLVFSAPRLRTRPRASSLNQPATMAVAMSSKSGLTRAPACIATTPRSAPPPPRSSLNRRCFSRHHRRRSPCHHGGPRSAFLGGLMTFICIYAKHTAVAQWIRPQTSTREPRLRTHPIRDI